MANFKALLDSILDIRDIFHKESSAAEIPPGYYDSYAGLAQYIFGTSTIIMSSIALEGVTLSLMSKVAPSKLSSLFLDCGLIVSLISSFSKVLGDLIIFNVGLSHRLINSDMVNSLSLFLACACCAGYYIVKRHFFFLGAI